MLSLLSAEDYDYGELTSSYMSAFNTHYFSQFLNTTQTGYAHTSSGTEFSLLLKAIFTSLTLCVIQLTMFCFFRNIFKTLYQPRCYCVPVEDRIEPLPKGYINWIMPVLLYNIHYYISLGLDTYFFVRYINVLLLFFSVMGSFNIIVLIPTNYFGQSEEYSAHGLDKLSLSNISSSNVRLLTVHFFMSLLTIGFFHWFIVYELDSVVKIRQSFLLSDNHQNSLVSNTVLVTNVPNELLDENLISSAFSLIPGGVKRVWFVNDFKSVSQIAQNMKEAVEHLEEAEMYYIKKYYKKVGNNRYKKYTNIKHLRKTFYPPIVIPIPSVFGHDMTFKIPGNFRMVLFQKPVDQIQWYQEKIKELKEQLEIKKRMLADGQLKRQNVAFIEFNLQMGAYVAHQILISSQGSMNKTVLEIHPRDIQWRNLSSKNEYWNILQKYGVTLICICAIILYIIPVSFIVLISQMPLLTKLMPFLRWIHGLPEVARDSLSSILPSILLSMLTEIMMILFRFLISYKGKLTGAEIELDLQKWYFVFLFIQQFLVVTILSSITVIFKQIFDQPTSIPVMLATNLPKSATFFFQFIAIKALGFCGNNFLRIDQLLLRNTLHRIFDKTPRQKVKRLTTLLRIKWGTIYPIYSVYASIGLTYTIISPLISIFLVFILFLVLLYYKYSLRYIYSHLNVSETFGKLYPSALFHLYCGIYCLECCLIGIFFLLKDSKGNFPMKSLGNIMCVVLILTIFGNITIYNKYSKNITYLPLINGKEQKQVKENEWDPNYHMLYLHPSFKYEPPKIWLPSDKLGISNDELNKMKQDHNIEGIITPGCSINFNTSHAFLEITVIDAPPDLK